MTHLIEMTVKDFEEHGVTVDMLRDAFDSYPTSLLCESRHEFNPKENIGLVAFTVPIFSFIPGVTNGERKERKNQMYMVRAGERTIAYVNVLADSSVDEIVQAVVKEVKKNAVIKSAPVRKALTVVNECYRTLNADARADGKIIRSLPHLALTVLNGPKVGIVDRHDRDEFQSEEVSSTLLAHIQQTVPGKVCEAVVDLIITLENQYEWIHGLPPTTYERRVILDGGIRLTILIGDLDGHYVELTLNNIYLLDQQTLEPIPDFFSALNDFQ